MSEIDWKEEAKKLAYQINYLIEGGYPEDACELLTRLGFTDEDGFWIGNDED